MRLQLDGHRDCVGGPCCFPAYGRAGLCLEHDSHTLPLDFATILDVVPIVDADADWRHRVPAFDGTTT